MTRTKIAGLLSTAAICTVAFASGTAHAATPSPTDKADVVKASAACVGSNAVSAGEMLVDGKAVTFGDGKTVIKGGSTVTVNFTVAAGCSSTKFGLAAYSDPSGNPDPTYQEVEKQSYIKSDTTTNSGGEKATLTVTLPPDPTCQYQVDFFSGNVITAFGPNNYYGYPEARLISVVHVERPNCNEVSPNVVQRTPPTSETTPTSTTPTSEKSAVSPNEVVSPNQAVNRATPEVGATEATNATSPTSAPAQVEAATLARTGGEQLGMAGIAGALALAGGSLRVAAGALRRRRTAYRGRHLR